MRLRVMLAVVALAFVATPVAGAATLPDLPGMGVANDAIASKSTTSSQPAASAKPSLPVSSESTTTSNASANTAEAAKSLRKLPGTGAIPLVSSVTGRMSSSRSAIPGPDALVTLAALGSFAALGALYMLRRLGRI